MSNLSIEDLLADFSDDGILDSSGDFTLDLKKAEDKLRHFSFPSPFDYLLKIVQCAVASQATRVEVEVNSRGVEIVFDGQPFEQGDMKQLIGHLLNEKGGLDSRRFRHLAAGLRGAVAVGPSSVTFESWGGEGGFRRTWDEQGWRLETLEGERSYTVNRFKLSRTLGQSLSAAGTELMSIFSPESELGEETALQDRCEYSPVEIVLDGEKISGTEFGAARYPGYKISNDPNPGEARPPHYVDRSALVGELIDPKHHLLEYYPPLEEGGVSSLRADPRTQATLRDGAESGAPCQMMFGVRAALDSSEVVFVEDGITIDRRPIALDCPGVLAVISAESLRKDLTGFQLVEDERFLAKLQEVLGTATKARAKLLDHLRLFPIRDIIREALKD